MPKYNLNRKYALKQFENLDLYVEGLESREEIKEELKHFDKIAQEYRDKLNQCCPDFPDCACQKPIKPGELPQKKKYPF